MKTTMSLSLLGIAASLLISGCSSGATDDHQSSTAPPSSDRSQATSTAPSLLLHIQTPREPLTIGDEVSIRVELSNQGDGEARDALIRLGLPDSVEVLQSAQGTLEEHGVRFSTAQLAARTSVTFDVELRVTSLPANGALELSASASAAGLESPIHDHAGTVVANMATTHATFEPGTETTLGDRDSRVRVHFPTSARRERLFTTAKPLRDIEAKKHGVRSFAAHNLGAFEFGARDAHDNDVHKFDAPLTSEFDYTPEQLAATNILAHRRTE